MLVLMSLLLTATAYADQSGRRAARGPIFDITHFDVIPLTLGGVDFQQTAHQALFAYRDASQSDPGVLSFRVVNCIVAAHLCSVRRSITD